MDELDFHVSDDEKTECLRFQSRTKKREGSRKKTKKKKVSWCEYLTYRFYNFFAVKRKIF